MQARLYGSASSDSIHATVVPITWRSTILAAGFVPTAIFRGAWRRRRPCAWARAPRPGCGRERYRRSGLDHIEDDRVALRPPRLGAEPVGAADATATVLELLIVIGDTLVRVSRPDQGSKPVITSVA